MKENLAIIPARANSKALKNKNISLLGGRPLINYTIDAAVESAFFDKIVVTTDSDDILEMCSRYLDNRLVSIKRPLYLCKDNIPLAPVIYNTTQLMETSFMTRFRNIFTLQPTSPFRTAKDIKRAYSIFKKERVASLLSVTEERHSIWKQEGNKIKSVRDIKVNRQSVEPYYIGNGAIFISKRNVIMVHKTRLIEPIGIYVMDAVSSMDIHTQEDMELAEWYLNRRKSE